MIICFVLFQNLIVGMLSSAYKEYRAKRHVIYLLETLSVREASEADDKYSAAVSCVYPQSIGNLLIGSYILAAKNEDHNRYALYFYFIPAAFFAFIIFFIG